MCCERAAARGVSKAAARGLLLYTDSIIEPEATSANQHCPIVCVSTMTPTSCAPSFCHLGRLDLAAITVEGSFLRYRRSRLCCACLEEVLHLLSLRRRNEESWDCKRKSQCDEEG